MAKRKSRALTNVAMIGTLGFLLGFFLYMWGYDYKVQRPQDYSSMPRTLRGMLHVDQKGQYGYSGPVAVLTLANATTNRVRILGTRQLFPLYSIKLEAQDEAGAWREVPLPPDVVQRYSSPTTKGEVFDKENDAISELVTGSGFTRAISLQYLYNLKPNTYKLTVSYQPMKIAEIMGDTFDLLDVTRESVTLTEVFEYPEKKAAPKVEVAPAAPKEEPANPETKVQVKRSPGESRIDD